MATIKKPISLVLILLINISLWANNSDELKLRVFNQDTIYFLGYDFTFMKFTPNERPVLNRNVAITIDAWIAYQKLYITPQTTLKRWLRKSEVEFLPCFFGCQCDESKNWISNNPNYQVPLDSIHQHIQTYQLPISEGIGFVVHVINLNKPKERAYSRFTFFDIATGEILWSELAAGKPDENGFNRYWGVAIHFSIKDFIDTYYKPEHNRLVILPNR